MNNHEKHTQRISKYHPKDVNEALDIIYGLNKSDFNNYAQMFKDIKLICEEARNGNKINN